MRREEMATGVERISAAVDAVQIGAWAVFLLVFPLLCLAKGMFFGAALCGVLGLFLANAVFTPSPSGAFRRTRLTLRIVMSTTSLVATVGGAWGLSRPLEGWTQVPGTKDWSNTSLANDASGELALTGSERRLTIGLTPLGATAKTAPFPGGLAWYGELAGDGTLWVAPRDDDRVWAVPADRLDPALPAAAAAWRSLDHEVGDARALAAAGDTVWIGGTGGIARVAVSAAKQDGATFHSVPSLRRASVVCAAGDHVLAAGRGVAFVSRDRGAAFETATGLAEAFPECALAQDGWGYVVYGGVMSGSLFVRAGGNAATSGATSFVERALPATDVRAIVTNPTHGAEVVIATWGAGVFHSRDGGLTWTNLGLRGIECRSLALSPEHRILTVAGANLVGASGLFRRPF